MGYKIGQILTSNQDIEVEKALSGEKVVIPKGNKIIIGADNLAHHIRNGMIQPLGDDAEIKGYDTEGIAEYLYTYLRCHFEIDEMLEGYDDTKERFIDKISFALDEIGF
uniref:Uncharacterized protein n=1 Tax=Dulem virus 39 TaxID=3145757 RepID=A0AAU8B745_9CAUD